MEIGNLKVTRSQGCEWPKSRTSSRKETTFSIFLKEETGISAKGACFEGMSELLLIQNHNVT